MTWDAFFTLHHGLDREGPGDRASVDWAVARAGLGPDGWVCDAGCGPGADLAALARHAPAGRVDGIELHDGFVAAAQARVTQLQNVTVRQGDMAALQGPYDLIWSAGALYFLGVTAGLDRWCGALAPGGVVAFSQACWFTSAPSAAARAYWDVEYPEMTDEPGVIRQINAAGYDVIDHTRLSDAAWEAYFTPMEARIADLRPTAQGDLQHVLDEADHEIDTWRAHRAEFGYTLFVVRPE